MRCSHGGLVRAAQSLRCSMRTHQESVQVCAYRLLITARGVRVCRGCGGSMVWCRRNKGAHLTNASLSSVGGLGPPKPPLTRHLVSSSERAEGGATRHARGQTRGRQPGRRAWRESVLSIHDPWCYTLSCNTCNLSRHPLSRAVCGAVRCGAWGGNCSDPQPSDEHESLTRACHVYCLGKIDCSSRQLRARTGEKVKGGASTALRRGVYLGSRP